MEARVFLCMSVGIHCGAYLGDGLVGSVGGDFVVRACETVSDVLMLGSSPGDPVSYRIREAFFSPMPNGLEMWDHDDV